MLNELKRTLVARLAAMRDERGATAIEYGLLAALIAAVIIITVAALGTNLTSLFETLADALGDAL
jgi:pilus assembly protein Flp/PilA